MPSFAFPISQITFTEVPIVVRESLIPQFRCSQFRDSPKIGPAWDDVGSSLFSLRNTPVFRLETPFSCSTPSSRLIPWVTCGNAVLLYSFKLVFSLCILFSGVIRSVFLVASPKRLVYHPVSLGSLTEFEFLCVQDVRKQFYCLFKHTRNYSHTYFTTFYWVAAIAVYWQNCPVLP